MKKVLLDASKSLNMCLKGFLSSWLKLILDSQVQWYKHNNPQLQQVQWVHRDSERKMESWRIRQMLTPLSDFVRQCRASKNSQVPEGTVDRRAGLFVETLFEINPRWSRKYGTYHA